MATCAATKEYLMSEKVTKYLIENANVTETEASTEEATEETTETENEASEEREHGTDKCKDSYSEKKNSLPARR